MDDEILAALYLVSLVAYIYTVLHRCKIGATAKPQPILRLRDLIVGTQSRTLADTMQPTLAKDVAIKLKVNLANIKANAKRDACNILQLSFLFVTVSAMLSLSLLMFTHQDMVNIHSPMMFTTEILMFLGK
jgi:hypothetical protein